MKSLRGKNLVINMIWLSFGILGLFLSLARCVHTDRRPAAVNQSTKKKPASTEVPYEVCINEEKNYLEKQIQLKVPADYLVRHDDEWDKKIPLKCIHFAQTHFRGSFANCESENEKPKPNALRPCLTENYLNLVYNAYHDVKNCFNLDPKRSFLQIMIESGFHINAINKTGFDSGISQFTKNGLHRVLDKDLVKKTKDQLLISSNSSCARIVNVFDDLEKDSYKIEKRCSMMSVPQNPYRALVLHYLHTLRDQIFFKNEFLKKRPELRSLMTQEILEQFVYMAYNRGITGTLRIVDGYLKNRKDVGVDVTSEDLDLFKNLSKVRKILSKEPEKKEIIKKSKFKNLSLAEYAVVHDTTYLATMAEARDIVKNRVGEECF